MHVSIVNWIKGESNGNKRLIFQRGDSIDSPFEYYDLDRINSALSLAVDLSTAKTLKINMESKTCFQGQTHGHEGFLVKQKFAEDILKSKFYNDVLFPYITANELIGGNCDYLPNRYVIDFRKHDLFSAKKYSRLFKCIEDSVYEDRKIKAKNEEERNNALLKNNPNARVNHHHSGFFREWWKLSYPRDEMMNILEELPRYCVCGRVTRRPIFEFLSSKIHPNDALQVFVLPDDYSFGILQSIVHWEWFTARCSTLKSDFRYTSNTVFDSFPWPQNVTRKHVKKIADASVYLRNIRRDVMKDGNIGLRELYRELERTPANIVNDAQNKLDNAVIQAYGMKRNEDILDYLLRLNLKLFERENNGEEVVGPGLPKFIDDPAEFISMDCIRI